MFCINVWLTVKDPADVAEIRGLLARGASLSRTEPGCLRFDVYHSQADEKCFLLNEHWESKEAWEAHRQEKAVTEIYLPLVLPRVERSAHVSTMVD